MGVAIWKINECFPTTITDNQKDSYRKREWITLEEKHRIYKGHNKQKKVYFVYRVDNGIIRNNEVKKCDYLLVADNSCDIFFLELKGCDIAHACEQIESTIDLLRNDIRNHISCRFMCNLRIVCSHYPTGLENDSDIKRFRDKMKKNGWNVLIRENGWVDESL